MGSLKLTTASSGSVILSPANTASDVTITVPATTATMATIGPAFSAYLSANQSLTALTYTKVQFDTEEFDTDSCFNTSNYRFTPTVAGYYQVNGTLGFDATTTNPQWGGVAIYKNGVVLRQNRITGNNYTNSAAPVSTVIYLNGSTDYLEIYAIANGGTGMIVSSSGQWSNFSAAFVRAA